MSAITITPTSGYSPSFSWQVGFNSIVPSENPSFRATVRPLNGLESYSRVPSSTILYEETGIVVDSTTNLGSWSFPIETNAGLAGGPYRDFQVVIEAYDSNGNTSAGNRVGSTNESGWNAYSQGYDIIAIYNPRQTGIELGNNISTQYTRITGAGETGYILNSGNGYNSLNYMGTHGEINIRYLEGIFNSNLAGGYIYTWTGQFPKLETAQGISGYDAVSKTRFDFDPTNGYVYSPTAAMKFRGANQIYTSLSFYDNLDKIAIDKGYDISTGLYLSDNAICYNDISAGSISIGGFQSIYSMQYSGNSPATGILGTGINILATQFYNGQTSVLYLSNPINISGLSSYSGTKSLVGGGAGGMATLLNNKPINNIINSFLLKTSSSTDDSLSIYLNGLPIKDDNNFGTDSTTLNIMQLASSSGYTINIGDTVSFSGRDNLMGFWSLVSWTGFISFNDGINIIKSGGFVSGGTSDFVPHYRDDGYLIVSKT